MTRGLKPGGRIYLCCFTWSCKRIPDDEGIETAGFGGNRSVGRTAANESPMTRGLKLGGTMAIALAIVALQTNPR